VQQQAQGDHLHQHFQQKQDSEDDVQDKQKLTDVGAWVQCGLVHDQSNGGQENQEQHGVVKVRVAHDLEAPPGNGTSNARLNHARTQRTNSPPYGHAQSQRIPDG
jgi:hypothetical protein